MKWDGFKNRLKKESHEQKQDVDIDAIWAAIEPEVDAINEKDKDRKEFVFWLFFGGILALTTGLFFYVMNGEIEGEIVAAENIEIEIIEKENKKIENSTNNSFRNTTEQNLTKDEEDLIEKTDAKVNSFNSDEIVDSDLNNNSINLPSSISENKNLINSIKGIEEGRRRENKTIIKSGVVSSSNKKENNKITSINNIEVKNDEIRNFSAFNVSLKKEESKLATLSEQEITNSSDGVTQAGSINSTEKEKTQISAALANSILNSRLRKLDLPTLTQAIKVSNYFILPTLEELSSPIASKDPKDKDPKGGGDKKSQN
ncbi:MAG: hypothetical protein AB8F74_08855, partial [Saprospiraceae bacterium]